MKRTISTLNDYVSKIEITQKMALDKLPKEISEEESLFATNSKSIATQLSSNSPPSQTDIENKSPLSPLDQLIAIRERVQSNSEYLQNLIDDGKLKNQLKVAEANFKKYKNIIFFMVFCKK